MTVMRLLLLRLTDSLPVRPLPLPQTLLLLGQAKLLLSMAALQVTLRDSYWTPVATQI